MRKLAVAAVVLSLFAAIAIADPATPTAGGSAVIMIGDDTRIRVGPAERLELSARTITADRATNRTELAGDVRIRVTRSGEVIVQVETDRAVVIHSPTERITPQPLAH